MIKIKLSKVILVKESIRSLILELAHVNAIITFKVYSKIY
jgi:hypothetical protein